MRQIKFRVWHKLEKLMFSVKDIQFYGDDMSAASIQFTLSERIHISYGELLQFTGLMDKNGKEIYEGDIIEFDADEWGSAKGNRWAVKWDDEDGSWSTGGGTNRECRVWKKVIGNIYENPDLLK